MYKVHHYYLCYVFSLSLKSAVISWKDLHSLTIEEVIRILHIGHLESLRNHCSIHFVWK